MYPPTPTHPPQPYPRTRTHDTAHPCGAGVPLAVACRAACAHKSIRSPCSNQAHLHQPANKRQSSGREINRGQGWTSLPPTPPPKHREGRQAGETGGGRRRRTSQGGRGRKVIRSWHEMTIIFVLYCITFPPASCLLKI